MKETNRKWMLENYFKRKWISCLEMKNCIQVYLLWIPVRYGRLSIYDWNKEKKKNIKNLPHLYFNLAVRYLWISNLIRTDESCGCDYIMITVISKENNQFLRCENTGSWKLFASIGVFSQQWFLKSLDSQRLSVYLSLAEVFSVGCPSNCLTRTKGQSKCLGQDRDRKITFQSPSLISGKTDQAKILNFQLKFSIKKKKKSRMLRNKESK